MMAALRALFVAASASGALPWLIAAALALAGIAGGAGFYAGHHWAATACAAAQFASMEAARRHEAEAVAKAQATSDKIWDIGLSLSADLAVFRERSITRTREVTKYVDASSDLARCAVPAAVQRVRDEQVRDSEHIAAGDPVQR